MASYNSSTETLTLTGSDTLAHYQSVLDSVTFSSGSNPSNSGVDPTRTLTWVLNDGAASNNIATAQTTISVSAPTKNDFNGDHTSDIVFQDTAAASSGGGRGHGSNDPSAGDALIFLINNGTVSASQTLQARKRCTPREVTARVAIPLLAHSGRSGMPARCPLIGVKRTHPARAEHVGS